MSEQEYITDEAHGENWSLYLGDSCERLGELADESIDLSVYSPPFQSLYVYSATPRDLGNSPDRETFFAHYGYVIRELFRLTKTGRLSCVHVADVATTKATHGITGLYDFPGDVIRAHIAEGWTYYGRVAVDKDPQAQAIRTKSQALLFVTKNKDSSRSRPAIGDTLLIFRKPGDSVVPVRQGAKRVYVTPDPNDPSGEIILDVDSMDGPLPDGGEWGWIDDPNPQGTGVSNEDWIEWARPVWTGVRETHTLNVSIARDDADERHLHPLQLDFIERCVRLYTNPGETVLSPFAGVGSEVWMARKLGRRGTGVELKPSYWRTAVRNLRALDHELGIPDLFGEAAS